MRRLHILMPMGGLGLRFAAQGFALPKPLIAVDHLPMFAKALSSFVGLAAPHAVTAIIRREHEDGFGLGREIKSIAPGTEVVVIEALTRGSVETCLAARPLIRADDGILVLDCDLWFESRGFIALIAACLAGESDISGGLLVFESCDPRYSFAELAGRRVLRTVEKVVISSHSIAGAYFFARGDTFLALASALLKRPLEKEAYTSLLYNDLIALGRVVEAVPVERYASFGTPEELAAYQASLET